MTQTTNSQTNTQEKLVCWTTPDEMLAGWPVIKQMYTRLTIEEYAERLKAIVNFDYRQFAIIKEADTNPDVNNKVQCLGVVGVWCLPRIWCGLEIDIDNFVVDENSRSLGIGKRLFDKCLEYAAERDASIAALDTFVDNPASHKFYFREGFSIRGYHFVKPLQNQSIWSH